MVELGRVVVTGQEETKEKTKLHLPKWQSPISSSSVTLQGLQDKTHTPTHGEDKHHYHLALSASLIPTLNVFHPLLLQDTGLLQTLVFVHAAS